MKSETRREYSYLIHENFQSIFSDLKIDLERDLDNDGVMMQALLKNLFIFNDLGEEAPVFFGF